MIDQNLDISDLRRTSISLVCKGRIRNRSITIPTSCRAPDRRHLHRAGRADGRRPRHGRGGARAWAPTTRSSDSSIRGEQPSRRGNKQLKRAVFLSAFAALADPASRAYDDKKIAQGPHHTQALLCLARRRADVLLAMLLDGTFYEPQPASAVS
jgi:hypothetical protein